YDRRRPLPHLYLLSTAPRRPPPSPLFPYTTLFRSLSPASDLCRATLGQAGESACPTSPGHPHHSSPGARCAFATSGSKAHLAPRSEEHTSELQSLRHLVCRLLLEKKKTTRQSQPTP